MIKMFSAGLQKYDTSTWDRSEGFFIRGSEPLSLERFTANATILFMVLPFNSSVDNLLFSAY